MRGKSQARSNKLYETMGKRTIDKVSKISRTKKEQKQERTPKKNIIYSQSNQDHIDLIQSLIRIFYKRAEEKEKELLNQFMKSMERERKIKHILCKNEDRHHDLKEMVQHLREEQKTLIDKLKQQIENDDENDLKEQIWKLYAYIFNCKKKDSIVKYPLDALTQIRKKIDEEKYVINLSFQTIQRLHSCQAYDKDEEQTKSFSSMVDDLDEGLGQASDMVRIKEQNGELKKKNLQLAKENLQKYKEMKKIEEQFEFLVEEKLHLTNKLEISQKKLDRLKLDKTKIKEKYQQKLNILLDDIFDLRNTLYRFSEWWKSQSIYFSSNILKKANEYECVQKQEKQKEYRQELAYITRAHENQMEGVSRQFEQLICKLEEEVTQKEMQINRYLKMVKELKEEERNEKMSWQSIQTSLEFDNHKMVEQNEEKEKDIENLSKRVAELDGEIKRKEQQYELFQNQIKSECGMLLQLKQKEIKTKQHQVQKLMMQMQDLQQQFSILFQAHASSLSQLSQHKSVIANFKENFISQLCQFEETIINKCMQTEVKVEELMKISTRNDRKKKNKTRNELVKVKQFLEELRIIQRELKGSSEKINMGEGITKLMELRREELEQKPQEVEKQNYYQILEELLEEFCFNHLNLDWNRKLKGIGAVLREKVVKYRNKIGQTQQIILKGKQDYLKLSAELKWMKESQQTEEIKQNQQKSTEEEFPAVLTASISFHESSHESINLSDVLNESAICSQVMVLREQLADYIEQNKKLKKKLEPDSFTDEELIFDI